MFEVKDVDLAGRIGILHTKSGSIETPAFFPVIDVTRQEITPQEIMDAGFRQVITNAYLTYKRFGGRAVEAGIHGILGFNGVVMTDSGAYQILEYGYIDLSQETIIEYQKAIGSDIGVILDTPTGDVDRDNARMTVLETLKRAREAIGYIEGSRTLWVLPIQGGRHLDLVEYSSIKAAEMPGYSIYGIGSPTVYLEKYRYNTVLDIIYTAKRNLPGGKPIHLFGAGHPLIIPYAVALGVDMFDSASYILYARDDRYITDYGVERLDNIDYFPCTCPVCSKYTPQELREMDKRDRTRLLALHNLYKIGETIKRVKQYIREGRLWELLEETSMKHPRAYDAMERIIKYRGFIEENTPIVKGSVRGIRLYDRFSLSNPKITIYRRRVMRLVKHLYSNGDKIILEPYQYEKCSMQDGEYRIIYYKPYIGIIPSELCGIYPTIQSHHPEDPPTHIVKDLVEVLRNLVRELKDIGVSEILLAVDRKHAWSARIIEELGGEVKIIDSW